MGNVRKMVVTWGGISGGLAYTVFNCDGAVDATAEVKAFFTSIQSLFSSSATFLIPNSGDVLDEATGTLIGGWTGTGGGTVVGTAGSVAYGTGIGPYVRWQTGAVVHGRRLRGRTWLTSISAAYYNTAGQFSAAGQSIVNPACATLVAANKVGIWHRPHHGSSDGQFELCTSGAASPQISAIKTRRT